MSAAYVLAVALGATLLISRQRWRQRRREVLRYFAGTPPRSWVKGAAIAGELGPWVYPYLWGLEADGVLEQVEVMTMAAVLNRGGRPAFYYRVRTVHGTGALRAV